jgi:molybdopterin molybdotransferase
MRTLFHTVRVKPGKPILAGRLGRCLVFGLPGNPVSGFTCFAVFVAPVLRRMLGYASWRSPRLHATLREALPAAPGRETYHLACIEVGRDGLAARRVACAGSGDVLALARANGFIVTPPEGASYAAGAVVSVLPRDPLWLRVDSAV